MNTCVYPGSFDPFTTGHLDILKDAIPLFDTVYIGILNNAAKKYTFSSDERVEMIENVIKECEFKNVKVEKFDGLLIDYLKKKNSFYVIRGLRNSNDFEYEYQMNAMNYHLFNQIRTLSFMSKPEHSFLSSSMIKEACSLGGDISQLVPACNYKLISERLLRK